MQRSTTLSSVLFAVSLAVTSCSGDRNVATSSAMGLSDAASPTLGHARPCSPRDSDYPMESIRANEQGTSHIAFSIRPDGSTHNIAMVRSSGFSRLDDAALNIVVACKFAPELQIGANPAIGVIVLQLVWRLTQ